MDIYIEIEKIFPQIEKQLTKAEIIEFINCDYNDLILYHISIGIWIRNRILKENSTIYKLFKMNGAMNKDDMSQLIIKLFYIHLKNKYKQP